MAGNSLPLCGQEPIMSNPPSTAKPPKQRPQKPKSKAQLASEANTLQQRAVRANLPRPSDRTGDGGHDQFIKRKS